MMSNDGALCTHIQRNWQLASKTSFFQRFYTVKFEITSNYGKHIPLFRIVDHEKLACQASR